MLMTHHRGPSQTTTMTGMGSVDEELNAMLQSGHHSQAQTSLASVMAPTSSSPNAASGSGDLFSSQYSAALQGSYPSSLASRNINLQQKVGLNGPLPAFGRGPPGRPAAPRWPFTSDEKWVLDAKNEALESSSLRAGGSPFGAAHLGEVPPLLNPPLASGGGGLQRYHSAPSSFLQSLADFNDEAFSQVSSSPLGGGGGRNSLLNSFFADNLTPIIECAPQQMDTDKAVGSSSLNDYEQFLASQNDFGRRSALSASMPSGKPEPPRSLAPSDGLSDSIGVRARYSKKNTKHHLIRQSSSPADLLAAIQDSMDESDPSLPIPANLSPEESLSGGTSEENNNSGKASLYSRDDCFLVTDAVVSGGLWNMPTSPGHMGGKRLRAPGEMTDDPGLPSDGALRIRVGEPGRLTRHLSLPVSSRPLSPGYMDMGLDDLADFSAPCRTRAKRGFATHPRSIAERVRRTRISERMKKLQDLVPNMDRQTNTADMLDEAVEYVKQLQLQVQELSNTVVQLKELQQAKELKAQG